MTLFLHVTSDVDTLSTNVVTFVQTTYVYLMSVRNT